MTPTNAEKAANLHDWLAYYLRLRHWHPWIDAPKRRAAVKAEIRSLLTRLRAWRRDQALRKPPTGGGFPGFEPAFLGGLQRAQKAVPMTAGSPAEHPHVRAVCDLPWVGVRAGEVGVVVHVYSAGGLEVEFPPRPGRPLVATVEPNQVEPAEKNAPTAKLLTHRI